MVVFGLVGNIIGLLVLAGGRGANLNMRAAFLEVVNDALGSVAVLAAAAVIATTGWLRADAVASLVIGVHDLHASQVATGLPVLTAHVVVDDSCFHDGHLGPMLDELQQRLHTEFDVEHSTIQFEATSHAAHEHETHA